MTLKEKNKIWQQKWRAKNPKKYLESYQKYNTSDKFRNNAFLKNFGITLDTYNTMLKNQNNCCMICEKPETSTFKSGRIKSLAVDHCHATKKVRGLLCSRCNAAIGLLKEDIKSLEKAIEYLKTS